MGPPALAVSLESSLVAPTLLMRDAVSKNASAPASTAKPAWRLPQAEDDSKRQRRQERSENPPLSQPPPAAGRRKRRRSDGPARIPE